MRREVLGERHPNTLTSLTNLAGLLPALDQPAKAARLLRQLEPALLNRLAAELYSTEAVSVRRSLAASHQSFQDVALSLAITFPDEARARRVAAIGLLRFKGLLAEEEAWRARLSRRGEDPRVVKAATVLTHARRQLSVAYQGALDPAVFETLRRSVSQAELALGRVSRDYGDYLRVKTASLDDLQGTLPTGAALVEFRRYHRFEFGNRYAEARWAAVVIEGVEPVRVVDLGEIEQTPREVQSVMLESGSADTAARSLYERLIGRLQLPERITRLYLAPDDVLHLLPFHRLIDEEGRHLGEHYQLGLVQSARDLLRPEPDKPGTGLLALGDIDFGSQPEDLAALEPGMFEESPELLAELKRDTAEAFRGGFAPLANTGPEVRTIERLYRQARPEEPTDMWAADQASEARLKALERAPRVLHPATHGFYRVAQDHTDRPMLLVGITLSGANQALSGDAEDGLLYALEVQDLNVEGTELVVLSACETAQGEIGHGEGVYGLVRALRTAGARNVLVTLRPIGDASAPKFMERFYRNWLSQTNEPSNPGKALQATQAYYMEQEPNFDWTPYVLIGG